MKQHLPRVVVMLTTSLLSHFDLIEFMFLNKDKVLLLLIFEALFITRKYISRSVTIGVLFV